MKLGSINNLANLYCPFYLVEEDMGRTHGYLWMS
jgi:hypothetical protein